MEEKKVHMTDGDGEKGCDGSEWKLSSTSLIYLRETPSSDLSLAIPFPIMRNRLGNETS